MRYLGGKSKLAKPIATTIYNTCDCTDVYIEPFVGGGSILCELAPMFGECLACDNQQDLILLWQALKDGWIPPSVLSQAQYDELKQSLPSALRGFAGFPCSFGGKWFGGLAKGGFAKGEPRNHIDEGKRNCLKQSTKISNVNFVCCDYRQIEPDPGNVIYCDPPYMGTTGYGSNFDHEIF